MMPTAAEKNKKQLKDQGIEIRKATKEEKAEAREYDRAVKKGRKTFSINCPWK